MIHVLFINEMTSCEKELLRFKKNWGIVVLRFQQARGRLRVCSVRGQAGQEPAGKQNGSV